MIQVRIQVPGQPERHEILRQLPARVGRSPRCEVRCEANGLWDEHLRVTADAAGRLAVEAVQHALVTVNDRRVERAVLRPRDQIRCGAALLEIALAPPSAKGTAAGTAVLWAMFWLLLAGQAALAALLLLRF